MTEDEIRAQFEEWAAKQWGNQAYRHTSNCCGEFIAYQAGRKAALLEAAERIARLRLGVVNPDWACGRDDAYNEVLRMTGKEMR